VEKENEILEILHEIKGTLKEHSKKLDEHTETFKEHGQILRALRSGQESLKAEMSEMKLQNAKEFGEIKEQMKDMGASIDLLKEESWTNKKDIHRVKKTLGMI